MLIYKLAQFNFRKHIGPIEYFDTHLSSGALHQQGFHKMVSIQFDKKYQYCSIWQLCFWFHSLLRPETGWTIRVEEAARFFYFWSFISSDNLHKKGPQARSQYILESLICLLRWINIDWLISWLIDWLID